MVKRGQVAVELFALIGALVLIFLVISVVERDRDNTIYDQRVAMDAKRISEVVSTEINTAVVVGNGYSHRFALPEYLATDTNYTLSIDTAHQFVKLDWGTGGEEIMPIITSNVTVSSGALQPGKGHITNNWGQVILSPS